MGELIPTNPASASASASPSTDLVPLSRVVNPVPPSGVVYKLWMDGQVPSELLWAIMEKYPNISEEAMVHDDYTVFHFRGGRPDNVWLSELVPHVFVLQGNADASILYTNRDLTPEQAKKMRAFLNRVNGLKLGEQKRRLKP